LNRPNQSAERKRCHSDYEHDEHERPEAAAHAILNFHLDLYCLGLQNTNSFSRIAHYNPRRKIGRARIQANGV
jgi:hypothetical protein